MARGEASEAVVHDGFVCVLADSRGDEVLDFSYGVFGRVG